MSERPAPTRPTTLVSRARSLLLFVIAVLGGLAVDVPTWLLVGVVLVLAALLAAAGANRELRSLRTWGLLAAATAIALLLTSDRVGAAVACLATAIAAAKASYGMIKGARSRDAVRARLEEHLALFAEKHPSDAAAGRRPWMSEPGWESWRQANRRGSGEPRRSDVQANELTRTSVTTPCDSADAAGRKVRSRGASCLSRAHVLMAKLLKKFHARLLA